MGDFTERFDRHVLRKSSDSGELGAMGDPAEKALRELAQTLTQRATFLLERFPEAERRGDDPHVLDLRFPARQAKGEATLRLAGKLNEAKVALVLESLSQIGGGKAVRDYVTVSVHGQAADRARKFVEAKILDFAKDYVG